MQKERIILCYGDSLTAGYGFPQEFSYPGLLQKLLSKNGFKYQVINAGVSGETTAGGLNRLPRFLDIRADIFILELGINDGLRGLSVESMKDNLQEIIDLYKSRHPETKLVIAGMDLPIPLKNQYINNFLKAYPTLAEQNKALLVPHFLKDVLGVPSLNLPDRLHPNKEGYKIIAQHIYESLLPLLEEPEN